MKRLIACLLACMLLIPGMLVYASAEKGDSIFTYDDSNTETRQVEKSAGEKYVEDLSQVDWDKVVSNRICLRENKDVVPDDYQWTVEDFPELDLEDVFDNGYSIYPILKNGGREYLTDAIEKMALREEFREVKLCHVVDVWPIDPDPADTTDETTIPDDTTAPVTDVQTTAPSTSADETTASPNVEKPTSPPTGDAGRYAAIAFAAALVGAVGVVLYRRRRCA